MKGFGWGDLYHEEILNLTIKPGGKKYMPRLKTYQFHGAKRIYAAVVKVHFTDGISVDVEPNDWYAEY